MHALIDAPKNKSGGSCITQSIKLLSIKYFLIFCSAPSLYKTPGNITIAATPLVASQLRQCIIKAKSAFDFGAKTPAGENLSSFINSGLVAPSQCTE
jgi:hypothetical protein